MTLDIPRIQEKLDEIKTYYDELIEDLPEEDDFVSERLVRRGVEKTVELIAEAIIDTCMIIIAGKGMEKPEDSREAIALLIKPGIVPVRLGAELQDFVSFRNLLVHRYAKIDVHREYENIQRQEDIPAFVRVLEQFVAKEKGKPQNQRSLKPKKK